MKRMAETADVTAWKYADEPDVTPGEAEKMRDIPHSIRVFEISGPLFFAAADEILTITSDKSTKVIVIRMRSVPAIDASAMRSLRHFDLLTCQRTADVRYEKRSLYRADRGRTFPSEYCGSSRLCGKYGRRFRS
mgnify:CR=1 FL=1